MRNREEVVFPIPRHIVDISVVIKTLKFSDLHRLVNDANENHNYIACLFILQTAHSGCSFHYLNCFLKQKLKNSKKFRFY